MKTVTIKFTNGEAHRIAYFLRKRYGRDKRANLNVLCEIAVKQEVAKQAQIDVYDALKELD